MDPQLRVLCAVLSVLFTTVAFVPYVVDLWQKKGDENFYLKVLDRINPRLSDWAVRKYSIPRVRTGDDIRPAIAGWFSWGLSDGAIFAAQLVSAWLLHDFGNVSWQFTLYVGGAMLVITLSMRKGIVLARMTGDRFTVRAAFLDWAHRKDTPCVTLVVLAVAAWWYMGNPNYNIYLTIASTIVGTWAVARNLYRKPRAESLVAWALFLVGGLFGVAAVKDWDVWNVTGLWPNILFVFVQGTIVGLAARRFLPRFKFAKSN